MGATESGNGWTYRLAEVERNVRRLQDLEPAVVKSQVADIKEDIHQLATEIGYIRKILTGFLVTFAFTGITVVISVVILTQG
jgi:hypothetical protein